MLRSRYLDSPRCARRHRALLRSLASQLATASHEASRSADAADFGGSFHRGRALGLADAAELLRRAAGKGRRRR